MEPTGTNGRTRHTLSDSLVWGLGLVLWWFSRWMARNAVSCGHDDAGKAFRLRPLSGSRTATTGIGRVAGFGFAGRRFSGRPSCIGFAVVMAQVRRPVPFRTRKLRPGRGDGTALERVWESSTPPHSTYGPSGRAPSGFPEGPFLFPRTGVFLHSVEVFGRREARGRKDSSTHWVFCSAGRPVGGRIPPPTGSPGTLGDPRNFRGASCPYPMVE